MIKLAFLSKKNLSKFFVVLWMVFSIGYIGWSIWNTVRSSLVNQAYQQGVSDAVNQLIGEAENNNCQPIKIFNKEQKKDVSLINMICLTNKK